MLENEEYNEIMKKKYMRYA